MAAQAMLHAGAEKLVFCIDCFIDTHVQAPQFHLFRAFNGFLGFDQRFITRVGQLPEVRQLPPHWPAQPLQDFQPIGRPPS